MHVNKKIKIHLESKDSRKAILELLKQRKKGELDIKSASLLIDLLLYLKKSKFAEYFIEYVNKSYKNPALKFWINGNYYRNTGDYEKALFFYKKSSRYRIHRKSIKLRELIVEVLFELNKMHKVERFIKRRTSALNSSKLLYFRTVALVRRGYDKNAYINLNDFLRRFEVTLANVKLHRILEKKNSNVKPVNLDDLAFDLNSQHLKTDLLLEDEKYEEALKVLGKLKLSKSEDAKKRLNILLFSSKFQEALQFTKDHKELFTKPYYYQKMLALAVNLDLSDLAKEYYHLYIHEHPSKGTFRYLEFHYYAMLGDFKKAFEFYKYRPLAIVLKKVLGKNQLSSSRVILLAEGGPGDEIRFSGLFKCIKEIYANKKIYITCDPRLYKLFKQNFPNITFIPIQKYRLEYPFDVYTKRFLLPRRILADICDNKLWLKIKFLKAEVYSLLELIPKHFSDLQFERINESILQIDNASLETKTKELVCELANQNSKLKVGISWRSGLMSIARNQHYLDLKDLNEVFRLSKIEFHLIQYDTTTDERELFNSYENTQDPIDKIDFKDDFESAGAYMKSLDLVISPCTTTAEYAAALGVKTIMFSNSTLNNYRFHDTDRFDIWRKNMKIVRPDQFGNKKSLVRNLICVLQQHLL